MNKNDLVGDVAQRSGLTKDAAAKSIDALLDAVASALKDNGDVRIVGFGTFSVAARPAREGRNPRTGKPISIPASRQPKFSAGKALKDALNG